EAGRAHREAERPARREAPGDPTRHERPDGRGHDEVREDEEHARHSHRARDHHPERRVEDEVPPAYRAPRRGLDAERDLEQRPARNASAMPRAATCASARSTKMTPRASTWSPRYAWMPVRTRHAKKGTARRSSTPRVTARRVPARAGPRSRRRGPGSRRPRGRRRPRGSATQHGRWTAT